MFRCEQVEQLGEWSGLAVDGDRAEGEIELKAEIGHRRRGWLGEELNNAWGFRQDRPCCGAGAVVSEGGQGEAAAAAELGLAQIAAVEGVEDLAAEVKSGCGATLQGAEVDLVEVS